MNYKQVFAIQNKNKERIKKVCPYVDESSGIYILTRTENDFLYAYIGQAKHLLTRLAQHLSKYQHIDLSIKKHGLFSEDNPTGWKIGVLQYNENQLDEMEQYWIKNYARKGYQLYNHTTGSQGTEKRGFKETQRKGYNEGLHNGYEKARKEIAHLFDLHLAYDVKKQGNKVQEKARAKFEEFIRGDVIDG